MLNHAHPIPSSAAASFPGAASPSLELLEARRLRDVIAALLRRERVAMADFLIALSDFDRRRGWAPLGHPHLFAFLVVELRLSKSAAFYRKSAAELLQDFPEVIEPLRDGRLCLSTIAELAKVMTEENRAVVAPRFFGLSAREAQALVAELQPRPEPPLRDLMTSETRPLGSTGPTDPAPSLRLELHLPAAMLSMTSPPAGTRQTPFTSASLPTAPLPDDAESRPSGINTDSRAILTSEFPPTQPVRVAPRPDEIEPLTASLTRLHFTVRREVVKKVEAARRGLGHAIPNATLEQVLEAGLNLLLEKQARARGQVKRPRAVASPTPAPVPTPIAAFTLAPTLTPVQTPISAAAPALAAAAPTAAATSTPTAAPDSTPTPMQRSAEPNFDAPLHRREGHREAIPAAVRRAVWARDQGRCTWPLDAGGRCESTHRLELDHIDPWALDGEPTEANLRLLCGSHNRLAARQAFGERVMARYGHAHQAGRVTDHRPRSY
jgi:hypothetical protein